MAVLAKGSHYFGADGFSVTMRRVQPHPRGALSHPYDVTEHLHYHDFTERVIVLQGQGTHWLGTESFPVCAGDVFVIQGLQTHYFSNRDALVLLNVMYDPTHLNLPESSLRCLPGYSALLLLEPNFRRIHDFSSRLRLGRAELGFAEGLANDIEAESITRHPGHEALLFSLLINLMVAVGSPLWQAGRQALPTQAGP